MRIIEARSLARGVLLLGVALGRVSRLLRVAGLLRIALGRVLLGVALGRVLLGRVAGLLRIALRWVAGHRLLGVAWLLRVPTHLLRRISSHLLRRVARLLWVVATHLLLWRVIAGLLWWKASHLSVPLGLLAAVGLDNIESRCGGLR